MNKFVSSFFRKDRPYIMFPELTILLVLSCIVTLLIDPLWKNYLLFTHSILEMACIVISFSTFVVTWSTYEKNSQSNRVIGFGFLVVSVFDILHTFFYQTSLFEYYYCREITSKFWILGRIVEALILLCVTLEFPRIRISKLNSLTASMSGIAIACLLIFSFPFELRMWTVKGMTALKIVLEFVIILILIAAFAVLIKRKSTGVVNYNYLFIAIFIAIIAELNFTIYKNNLAAFYPAIGHILRVLCYAYLFRGVFVNVAEYPYKKMEKALNLSENLFKVAFDSAPIGMALISLDGKWVKVNNSLCGFLGYPSDELLKMSYMDILYPDDGDMFNQAVNKLTNGGLRAFNYEKSFYSKTSGLEWAKINLSLVRNAAGSPLYLVAQIEDIGDRKRAEELTLLSIKNEALIKEARELERLRTEFFANLSHEFRTPLNVILGSLQLIKLNMDKYQEVSFDKISANMKVMKQNCMRLLRLINNLIDITKIDAGFYNFKPKNLNIVSVVEDITLSIAEYIKNRGISITFDTDVEEKIIACDADKIERIILNIISNSLKFTDKGGSIKVDIYDKGDAVDIVIQDTGLGIPEDKLELIFERFRQADNSTTRNKDGSGIGLSLVKSLVEMHSGKVSLSSKLGEGCKTVISLPAIVIEDADDNITDYNYDTIQSNHVERINVEFSDIYFANS